MSASTWGDFEKLSRLGAGSFGTVYKVKRYEDGEIYVIKEVRIQELSQKERLDAINEVNILSNLSSDYVVRYRDSFIDKEFMSLNIVMDFCDRGDLSIFLNRIKDRGGRNVKRDVAWNISLQIFLGLHYLHSKNILHRDLKTANVFLSRSQNPSVYSVKLGDLGVAKLMDTSTAFAQTVVGTPYYLSPELCSDHPYRDKSDCWALGVLMFECCELKRPFEARNPCALIMKIVQSPFAPFSAEIKQDRPEFTRLVTLMLQKEPANRPSIKEVLNESFVRDMLALNNLRVPDDIAECSVVNKLLPNRRSSSEYSTDTNETVELPANNKNNDASATINDFERPPLHPSSSSSVANETNSANTAANTAAETENRQITKPSSRVPLRTSGTGASVAPAASAKGKSTPSSSGSVTPPIHAARSRDNPTVRGNRVRGSGSNQQRHVSEKARTRYQIQMTKPNSSTSILDKNEVSSEGDSLSYLQGDSEANIDPTDELPVDNRLDIQDDYDIVANQSPLSSSKLKLMYQQQAAEICGPSDSKDDCVGSGSSYQDNNQLSSKGLSGNNLERNKSFKLDEPIALDRSFKIESSRDAGVGNIDINNMINSLNLSASKNYNNSVNKNSVKATDLQIVDNLIERPHLETLSSNKNNYISSRNDISADSKYDDNISRNNSSLKYSNDAYSREQTAGNADEAAVTINRGAISRSNSRNEDNNSNTSQKTFMTSLDSSDGKTSVNSYRQTCHKLDNTDRASENQAAGDAKWSRDCPTSNDYEDDFEDDEVEGDSYSPANNAYNEGYTKSGAEQMLADDSNRENRASSSDKEFEILSLKYTIESIRKKEIDSLGESRFLKVYQFCKSLETSPRESEIAAVQVELFKLKHPDEITHEQKLTFSSAIHNTKLLVGCEEELFELEYELRQ